MHAGMHDTPTLVESPPPLSPSLSNSGTNSDICEWKGIVLSLIRHAESTANTSSISHAGINSQLSSRGVSQAKQLAEEWANIRIDHLLSSFLNRAVDTAQAIADAQNAKHGANNKTTRKESQKSRGNLTNGSNHKLGSEVEAGSESEAELDLDSDPDFDTFISVLPITLLREALIKKDMDGSEDTRKEGERSDDDVEAEARIQNDPLGQPETLEQVSARAYTFLSTTIDTFGIVTPSNADVDEKGEDVSLDRDADRTSSIPSFHPDEIDLEKWTTSLEEIPEGLPHIVAVGHNIFFCELYEQMIWWNDEQHESPSETKIRKQKDQKKGKVCWDNADWSRHLVWIRRPRPDSTGWELKFKDLRLPGRCNDTR